MQWAQAHASFFPLGTGAKRQTPQREDLMVFSSMILFIIQRFYRVKVDDGVLVARNASVLRGV